jgi:hypothetical protein
MCGLVARVNGRSAKVTVPVVYLFHSYEFCDVSDFTDHRPWHHHFYARDPEARYRANWQFLAFLRTIGAEHIAATSFIEQMSYVQF